MLPPPAAADNAEALLTFVLPMMSDVRKRRALEEPAPPSVELLLDGDAILRKTLSSCSSCLLEMRKGNSDDPMQLWWPPYCYYYYCCF
jgi:hypothetical protein